ncbi:MAG: carboxypeptidase regulatory-like domain-containing protein [Gemmatimonadaceae bacterium]|nr:carboxypeptidase regulatory-like domain-containing protein [Gemmatimonadaceae bacterium]
MRILVFWAMIACLPSVLRAQSASNPSADPKTAVLAATVLSDSTERPIASAVVSISALQLTARTDSAGNFTLSGIVPGRYTVMVRAVGFAPLSMPMTFGAGERVEADLLLRVAPQTLERVDVRAAPSSGNHPRIAEFDERRKMGLGKFMTQDEFDKEAGRKLVDILTGKFAGLGSATYGSRRALISNRGLASASMLPKGDATDKLLGAKVRCYVQVIVDGILRYGSRKDEPLLDIDTIDPNSIAAAEYYTVSQLPSQFKMGGGAPCGTLVLWQRY